MSPLFRFDVRSPLPVPVLDVDPDGTPRVADGDRYLDLAQAVAVSGMIAAELEELWHATVCEFASFDASNERVAVHGDATVADSLDDIVFANQSVQRSSDDLAINEWGEFVAAAQRLIEAMDAINHRHGLGMIRLAGTSPIVSSQCRSWHVRTENRSPRREDVPAVAGRIESP